MPTDLTTFLSAPQNTVSREYLTTTRLVHDLLAAAAECNYDLCVYTPAVDRDGFDLILDDRGRLLPLQLKTVMSNSTTQSCALHRRLLRPPLREAERWGFRINQAGIGLGGGVILIEVDGETSPMTLTYHYTDLYVLTAFWLGIFEVPTATKNALASLRASLEDACNGNVTVPHSAFVTAKSPESLLCLMGFHSNMYGVWPFQLAELAAHTNLPNHSLAAPEANIRTSLKEHLLQLVCNPLA